eukprot:CAMPEP_0113453466 /NCGR_PEP_ID=MMETSP0014_2-20120614/7370_1 /TAXON_ID=2857 /ORGANISM="Nitzschia sp." /LENGTH=476 /DNA_ID=CAMNT_0000344857 /DNA_START=282 /DNA_END=1712 /DNA_ORIENTATION=- /assembly_acc=CAM_ASM_000159
MISTSATPSRGSSRNNNNRHHQRDDQDEGQEEHCQRRARRISILSGLFSRRRHGDNSPPSLSSSRPSPSSPSKQKTRLSKRRRSRSPKRQRDDKTGRSSFLPQCVDDGLDASNPFLFDNTIHEEQPYPVPTVPNSPQPCQHQLLATAGISATEEGDFDFELNYLKDEDQREIIMFLVRHGEAAHNIKEREAKTRAKEMSVREGLSADDPVTLERMESARKSVLADETLRDAQLSDKGRKEAQEAHEKLQTILSEHPGLPRPNYVVVSPLTRTLETCDIIFPDHDDIHVRSAIAERKTLKPPDTRSHVSQLSQRKSFQHFSMNELRVESMNNLEDGGSTGDGVAQQQNSKDANGYSADCTFCNGKGSKKVSTQEIVLMHEDTEDPNANWANWATPADQWKEEDKAELRRRTGRIAELLAESESTSVAVVTHKGYLRELERGPLGNPDAKEFKNAEIRIYKITFSVSEQKMIKSERLI